MASIDEIEIIYTQVLIWKWKIRYIDDVIYLIDPYTGMVYVYSNGMFVISPRNISL